MDLGPVERAIRKLLQRHGYITAGALARALGISRQGAHKHLRRRVAGQTLVLEGRGRGARYLSVAARRRVFRYRRAGLSEEYVGNEVEDSVPFVRALPKRSKDIFRYALAEMVNNAVDHSRGERVGVTVEQGAGGTLHLVVEDDGVGALAHLRTSLRLPSLQAALAELGKGKVTTDPAHHTGQGVFFTSKAVEQFTLESNGLKWRVDNPRHDQGVGQSSRRYGTSVGMWMPPRPRQTLKAVFDAYTHNLEFDRTRVHVKLFEVGTHFMSRSEARRLMHGLDAFREVVLDFEGVDIVGQGFVDEVFRVWATAQPEVRLLPVRMNRAVAFFVQRERATPPARASRSARPGSPRAPTGR